MCVDIGVGVTMCVCINVCACVCVGICHHMKILHAKHFSLPYYFILSHQLCDIRSTQTIYNLDYSTVLLYPFFSYISQTHLFFY